MEKQEKEVGAAMAAPLAEENTVPAGGANETVDEDDESLVIQLKKPYKFEGKEYTEIDLSGLEDLVAEDMIAVNKIMNRSNPGIDVMPEVSMEYACYIAAKASKMPVEFFKRLPAKSSMKVKNRVMGFLFGSE